MREHGVQIIEMTPEDQEKVRRLCEPLIDKWIERGGPMAKEIIDTVTQWKEQQK